MNDETLFILKEAGINPDDLIFWVKDDVEKILMNLYIKGYPLFITLTDHSEIHSNDEKDLFSSLNEKREGTTVIDHHQLGSTTRARANWVYYKNVGATATLIFEHFSEAKVTIPKEIALLMLSAILSDTKNLENNVHDEDKQAVKSLMQTLGYSNEDKEKLFIAQTHALNTLDVQEPVNKIVGLDKLRRFPAGNPTYSFTTFGLNYDEGGLFDKYWPEIRNFLIEDMSKKKLEIALFNLTRLNERAKVANEELYIVGTNDNLFKYMPALGISNDELRKSEELPNGVSVYKLEYKEKGRFARKETVAKITDYFSYIQAEDTIYRISGGKILDNYVNNLQDLLKKAIERLKLPLLSVQAEQTPDGNVKIVWKFGNREIIRFFELIKEPEKVVNHFNNILVPNLNGMPIDLRKKQDYERVKGIAAKYLFNEAPEDTYNFVVNRLLPKIEDDLWNRVDINQRIQENLDKPGVIIVAPELFKRGAKNALSKAAELSKVMKTKVALYGESAEKIGAQNEAVITAKSLDDLLKDLSEKGIKPVVLLRAPEDTVDEAAKRGIIQIIVPADVPIIVAMAKAIDTLGGELWSDIGADNAFVKFIDYMQGEDLISPVSKESINDVLAKLKEGTEFRFPGDVKETERITKNKEAEEAKKIVLKYF